MSTLAATNLKHASSASNNIVLDASGNATFAGTAVPSSSFMRNRIINGDMRIDQRNAGASVTPGDGNFTLDRWKMSLAQASKLSVQRSTVASTGFVNSLLATSLSAYSLLTGDTFGVYQPIEGFNAADLGWGTVNAQTVTVSFWVRGSLTGTYSVAVYNAAGNRSCVVSYVINAANTWEYKTVTITGDTTGTWATDNTAGIQVRWDLGSGATYGGATSGTWNAGLKLAVTGQTSVVGTSGATFYLTGVQLEVGSAATPFERRQYGQELMLCQRYCYVLPNTSSLANGPWGSLYTATAGRVWLKFPVPMRATPTMSGTSSTNTFEIVGIGGVATSTIGNTVLSGEAATFDGFSLSTTGTLGQPFAYRGPGTFSAEL